MKYKVGDVITVQTNGDYHLPVDIVRITDTCRTDGIFAISLISPQNNESWWLESVDYDGEYESEQDALDCILDTKINLINILYGIEI